MHLKAQILASALQSING